MSTNADAHHWNGHDGPVLSGRDGYTVVDCRRCGFAHLAPIPEDAELQELYEEHFYPPDLANIHIDAEEAEWMRMGWIDRLITLEEHLPPDRRRLLDIGCGTGHFLEAARERGWRGTGLEPSGAACAVARAAGLDVAQGFITDDIQLDIGPFDAVHSGLVFEHLRDPAGALRALHRLIAPDGLITIAVPNDFNPLQLTHAPEVARQWWVGPPVHVNYFRFDCLERLLARSGFAPVARDTNFPIDMFLLMGRDYVGNAALGSECHAMRRKFDLNLEHAGRGSVRRALYRSMAAAGLGRLAIVTARRTALP